METNRTRSSLTVTFRRSRSTRVHERATGAAEGWPIGPFTVERMLSPLRAASASSTRRTAASRSERPSTHVCRASRTSGRANAASETQVVVPASRAPIISSASRFLAASRSSAEESIRSQSCCCMESTSSASSTCRASGAFMPSCEATILQPFCSCLTGNCGSAGDVCNPAEAGNGAGNAPGASGTCARDCRDPACRATRTAPMAAPLSTEQTSTSMSATELQP
mmetsp:Transcript_35525/g.62689  ORF Transcript_35525/g.62689 Transcript_35525/m.62689 type:complete len:224 (+) Transcript_35525:2314-2985(+)